MCERAGLLRGPSVGSVVVEQVSLPERVAHARVCRRGVARRRPHRLAIERA
ncbi:MAG: hypothetical protein ACI8ZW_000275 [Yoonia sp.]|jgi:hypothetical protein